MRKKLIILIMCFIYTFSNIKGQKDSIVKLEDCPLMEKYLSVLWQTDIRTWDGAPLLIDGYVISTFGTDSAILLITGERTAFPLKLKDNVNIVFESNYEILIKNINTNETLFKENRKAGISMRKSPHIISGPAIIYQKEKNKLIAYNFITKTTEWEFTNENQIRNNFIITNAYVYFFDKIGLKVLDSQNGKFLWEEKIGDVYATPYLIGNNLFALTNRNGLFCIDINERKVNWHFSDHNSSWASEHDMLIENGKIYFVSNWIYSFDLSGNQIWVSKNIFYQEISIVNDLIIGYIEDNSPIVVAINKKDGIPMYFMTFGNILNRPMRFSAPVGNKIVAEPAFSNQVFCFEINEQK